MGRRSCFFTDVYFSLVAHRRFGTVQFVLETGVSLIHSFLSTFSSKDVPPTTRTARNKSNSHSILRIALFVFPRLHTQARTIEELQQQLATSEEEQAVLKKEREHFQNLVEQCFEKMKREAEGKIYQVDRRVVVESLTHYCKVYL